MKQGTQEWLDMRKNYIGASDAPILMGVSPFKRSDGLKKTPYVLWMEKLDLLPADKDNPAMKYGREMEESARQAYEEMVGDYVAPKICFHKEINYLMASLDGLSLDGTLAVEIKNANSLDHHLAKTKKVPDKYYPQVQQQMACADLEWMQYFSYHKGEGVVVDVLRDEDYLEELYAKEKEFWDCVKNFKAPALTSNDYHEKDDKWYAQALKLLEVKQKRKELEAAEEEMEGMLREMSEGKNSFFKDVRYTSSLRKGNIDYKKIPELKGIDLEGYRKSSSYTWTISCK
jgi:putative phage-type endonuclease